MKSEQLFPVYQAASPLLQKSFPGLGTTTTTTTTTLTQALGGSLLHSEAFEVVQFILELTLLQIPIARNEGDCTAATMNRITARAKSAACSVPPGTGFSNVPSGQVTECLGPEDSICALYWSLIVLSAATVVKNSAGLAELQVSPPSIKSCLLNLNPKANFWPKTFITLTRDATRFAGIDTQGYTGWDQKGQKFSIIFELWGAEKTIDGYGILPNDASDAVYGPVPRFVSGVWGFNVADVFGQIQTKFNDKLAAAATYADTVGTGRGLLWPASIWA